MISSLLRRIVMMSAWLKAKCLPAVFNGSDGQVELAGCRVKPSRLLSTLGGAVVMLALFQGAASAKDLVRIGYGPFLSGGALFIALDKGYFDTRG
jgi:hypothetical protein